MNNDLEQFSEERLMDMQKHVTAGMTLGHADALLIRQAIDIALSAKQAKPEYHIVRLELNDAWGSETVLNAYESQLDASKCKGDHGGVIIPCYTTPHPAHTEQDGWIKCSEQTPQNNEQVLTWNGQYKATDLFLAGCFLCNKPKLITHWMPLPAAPKPEM